MRRGAALVTAALALLLPAAAGAHTHLLDLRPEPEAVLQHPPDAVRLVFNQPVDVIRADTGIGRAAVDVSLQGGGRQLVLRPRSPLRAGRVDVRFRVLSQDGHVLRGHYGFSVRRGAAPRPDRGEALQVRAGAGGKSTVAGVAHGLHHLLFVLAMGFVVAGPLLFAALPAGALRVICLLGALAALLCATLTWLAAEGDALTRALLPSTIGDAAGTSAGAGWLLRAGLWVAAAVAVRQRLVAGAALAGVAVSLALSGHAGTHGGAGSVVVDTAHVLAAGVWLGGLAALVWAIAQGGDRAALTASFTRVAAIAFALLVASGAANALLRVGSVDALTDRAYGRLVLAKAGVALAIAAAAALGRRGSELVLGGGALVLAAILVETTPPS